jgi:hypothetical protein
MTDLQAIDRRLQRIENMLAMITPATNPQTEPLADKEFLATLSTEDQIDYLMKKAKEDGYRRRKSA